MKSTILIAKIAALSLSALVFAGCSAQNPDSSSIVSVSKSTAVEPSALEVIPIDGVGPLPPSLPLPIVQDPSRCMFNGEPLSPGQQVTAFQNSSVEFGQSCVSEVRRCENGNLSGSYNYANCQVGVAASCQFNGRNLDHGQTVTAFSSSSVVFGSSCEVVSQLRTCDNGVLSGSAQFAKCEMNAAKACLFNGVTLGHGQSVNAFARSEVGFSNSCQEQKRTCVDGVLSGDYSFANCQVGAPAGCLLQGKNLAHGEQVSAFFQQSSIDSSTQSCQSEIRSCQNGVLSGSAAFVSCELKNPEPQPTTDTALGSTLWQFPGWCGGVAGFGIGMHSSRYSTDGGATWIYVVGSNVPLEMRAVWDYLVTRYTASTSCVRPNIPYQANSADAYVSFDPNYLPKPNQCGYHSVTVCTTKNRFGGCTAMGTETKYVCQ